MDGHSTSPFRGNTRSKTASLLKRYNISAAIRCGLLPRRLRRTMPSGSLVPGIISLKSGYMKLMTRVLKILAPISLLPVLTLAGCTDSPGPRRHRAAAERLRGRRTTSAVPVMVAKVERSTIPVELHAIGTGQAFKTVSVESQVAGIVKEVHYQPGTVRSPGRPAGHAGQESFSGRPRAVRSGACQGQGAGPAQSGATAALRRTHKQGIVSKEQYDQYLATSTAAEATVHADEAAIQTAKIQLSYCSIYAPISGVTGAQLVYPGATVKANDAPGAGRDQPGFADLRRLLRSPAVSGVDQEVHGAFPFARSGHPDRRLHARKRRPDVRQQHRRSQHRHHRI